MKQLNIVNNSAIAIMDSGAQMTSREIAALLGCRHDSVKRAIKRLVESGVIQLPPLVEVKEKQLSSPNNKAKIYIFSGETGRLDSITVVAQLSPEFTKALVIRWDELESKNHLKTPVNYIEALEALVVAEKEKALIVDERDHAVATKAEISRRREATAMATASKEKRRAEKLEAELDKSKEWITIKRAEMLCHGQKFNWRELKSVSNDMGYEIKKVFDENYGNVNAYHRDVWLEAYALKF